MSVSVDNTQLNRNYASEIFQVQVWILMFFGQFWWTKKKKKIWRETLKNHVTFLSNLNSSHIPSRYLKFPHFQMTLFSHFCSTFFAFFNIFHSNSIWNFVIVLLFHFHLDWRFSLYFLSSLNLSSDIKVVGWLAHLAS